MNRKAVRSRIMMMDPSNTGTRPACVRGAQIRRGPVAGRARSYSVRRTANCAGFTLIELIVAIVILGIGAAAFMQLINSTTVASVDPMVRQQANAIAQSYLEEVLLNPFCDPDLSTDCPAFCTGANVCSTCGGTASPGAETRPVFDDVCDYDGLADSGARNQFDQAIPGLSDYNVTVTVDDDGVSLDGLSSLSGQVVRVDVNVTHAGNPNINVILSGFRTNF